jgi:hypothetical protein
MALSPAVAGRVRGFVLRVALANWNEAEHLNLRKSDGKELANRRAHGEGRQN